MKFHRVLLFTSIQMDITKVGQDLHVLLTNTEASGLACTAWAVPDPAADPVSCEVMVMESIPDLSYTFCDYVADRLARETGKKVLCTGGLFITDPTERDIDKLYENIDEMIHDWIHFLD